MNEITKVEIFRGPLAKELDLPVYKTMGSVGMDLVVAEEIYIPIGAFADVKHDINIGCPPGVYFQVLPRSSIFKKGLIMAMGLIDSDYRGKIFSPVFNIGTSPVKIARGTRISQIVFMKQIQRIRWGEIHDLDNMSKTDRGEGGFGSTGN